jgi:glucokinase
VPSPGGFPQPGSLESLAAGSALDRLAETSKAPCVRALPDHQRASIGEMVVSAAKRGDSICAQVLERWAEWVGIAVANAINVLDPREVVIGGGAAGAGELLLGPVRRIAFGYVHPGLQGRARVRLSRHGPRAGTLGAALLARDEMISWGPGHTALARDVHARTKL